MEGWDVEMQTPANEKVAWVLENVEEGRGERKLFVNGF